MKQLLVWSPKYLFPVLQHICGLVRALIRKPALLILDEATSALDSISEQKVVETVLSLRNDGMTTLSVSHHPNTAMEADTIIVLKMAMLSKLARMKTHGARRSF
ncbi:LOW QUALITY PROTEIN: hypothetical protein ACHAWF_005855 [Thalassiosira exigua]